MRYLYSETDMLKSQIWCRWGKKYFFFNDTESRIEHWKWQRKY